MRRGCLPLALPLLAAVLLPACDDAGPAESPRFILNEIVTAGTSTCGLTPGGSLYCWGTPLTTFGECIDDCVLRPVPVLDSTRLRLHGLAGGLQGAVCGIDPLGTPRCGGQLLTDIDLGYVFPDTFAVLATGATISAVAVGQGHICGIGPAGATCWGDHDGARRGDYGPHLGTGTDFVANVVPGGASFTSLSLSFSAGCGVEALTQAILCWGYDPLLGAPSAVVDSSLDHCGFFAPCSKDPVPTANQHLYSAVVSGSRHGCGLEVAGGVYCWGWNSAGQLGRGDTLFAAAPVAVALPAKAVSLVAGPQSTCATLATGELLCWGHDLRGPGRADLLAPVKLGFRQRFKAVALSQSHACGLTDKGEAYCWGNNDLGQLGTGNTALAAKPVAVLPPLP